MSTGLLLDGVFASEHIDSSGEILDIKGLDITDFDEGKGLANYEHKGHDGNSNGEEIVGKIIFARKIFKQSDCTNEREKMFWDKVGLPFLYGIVRLYDGAGHEGAKALAAIIRDSHANDEPIIVGFSIEGSTLEKDSKTNRLVRCIARKVALTVRACNKMAISGLLADPNAPEGYEKFPVKPDLLAMVPVAKQTIAKKSEADPMYIRLGGSEAVYGSEITKAMTAGSYNAAPGTLSGGAALQVEDRTRKALAMAALRDWDKVTPFRKFIKHRMPDASDEFLDHFSDLVERHMFRVKKAEEVITSLAKAGKLKSPREAGIAAKPKEEPRLTIQGRAVPKSMVTKTTFDPKSGQLFTPKGIFQAQTPSAVHPHLARHMRANGMDPSRSGQLFANEVAKSRDAHKRAMNNWFNVNQKFVNGNIDPGLVSHAVAFALMSPGVPVPMQETMYGHFVDSLKSRGLASIVNPKDWDAVYKDWMARNRSGLPQHSRQHFLDLEKEIRSKNGAFIGFNKPDKFAEYFSGYLKDHHNDIVDAIRQAKGDAHPVARRLTEVRGIAPKLSRYLLGMMGAGNMVVPDTHFTRHLFGARPDAPGSQPGSSPDSESQNYLKHALLGTGGAHDVLEGIDDWYLRNHDAVKHLLADPEMGPYFKGRENQAIFPAFWSHWISIPGHEAAVGTPNRWAQNAGTDHAPFWDAVAPMLQKSENYDADLPMRTAMQHRRWVEQYGPVHALGLYYQYLVPRLQANDALRGQEMVRKFQSIDVDLRKAVRESTTPNEERQPERVKFRGHTVSPGEMFPHKDRSKRFSVLGTDPKEFTVVPSEKLHSYTHQDMLRIPRAEAGDYRILRYPETLEEPLVVNALTHGVGEYNTHPEVQNLVHGFNFGYPKESALQGSRAETSFWSKTPNGQRVYVKAAPEEGSFNEARKEGVYSALAREYFGLGKYVPRVGVVRHPKTGQEHAIIEHMPGEEFAPEDPAHEGVLNRLNDSGELDKLGLMDMIMGNSDRSNENYLVDPENNTLRLIDHNILFDNAPRHTATPMYWSDHEMSNMIPLDSSQLHPAAVQWAHSLKPDELESMLRRYEVPDELVQGTRRRLEKLQGHLKHRPNSDRESAWVIPQALADMPDDIQAKYSNEPEKE